MLKFICNTVLHDVFHIINYYFNATFHCPTMRNPDKSVISQTRRHIVRSGLVCLGRSGEIQAYGARRR